MKPRILVFAGSSRRESLNKRLAQAAGRAAEAAGAEVSLIDLADYSMPLFNQDLEAAEGLPENAKKLKQLFIEHHGLIISSPEYNSSFSPLLKNTLDWVSRAEAKGEPPLSAYTGKTAALFAASPGALGGIRGLVHVRSLLENIRVMVLPSQVVVPNAHAAFDEEGNITDNKLAERVADVSSNLVKVTQALLGE